MPNDWRELSQQAREALLAAERIERDDLAVQFKLRRDALLFARDLIDQAGAALDEANHA